MGLFSLKHAQIKKIIDIISDLSSNKATGPNSISIRIMKSAKDDIVINLSVTFNLFFSSEVFPNKLKIAKILPVI